MAQEVAANFAEIILIIAAGLAHFVLAECIGRGTVELRD